MRKVLKIKHDNGTLEVIINAKFENLLTDEKLRAIKTLVDNIIPAMATTPYFNCYKHEVKVK